VTLDGDAADLPFTEPAPEGVPMVAEHAS